MLSESEVMRERDMEVLGLKSLLEGQQDISRDGILGIRTREEAALWPLNINSWGWKQSVYMTQELAGDVPGCKLQETSVHSSLHPCLMNFLHATGIHLMQACSLCFPVQATTPCESRSLIFVPTKLSATTQKEDR